MEEILKIVSAVINTLGTVEVHGEANLSALLGSIKALKYIVEMDHKEDDGNGKDKDSQG